ncbi:hypothetical protein [Tsuneonella sp. HG222]
MSDGISEDAPGLFGWVPKPPRGQGRPGFEWTREKSNRLMVLFACGYTQKTAAPVIGCDVKTLRKVYSRECAEQSRAALVVRSGMMAKLVAEAEDGSVAAIKQLEQMMEREQARVFGERVKQRHTEPARSATKGKKEEQQEAATKVEGRYGTRPPPPGLQLN